MRKQTGFTLIEIAIVLVIIGLLLGGVLKGQELIQSARVRNLISIQDGTKAAFFGFQDRYRALPGDYKDAATNINCTPACSNGNGNGIIETAAGGAPIDEDIAVWEHLSKSGFINGSYTYHAAPADNTSNAVSPYSIPMQVINDAVYEGNAGVSKLNVKTGNQIPSDIMGEIDRKVDDGLANSGSFRFSTYAIGTAPTATTCFTAGTGQWVATGTIDTNCGGASLF